MSTETPIQEFARLNLLIQRYRAAQQPVPLEVQQRAQQLEVYAQTRLTPQQAQQAMLYVAQEQEKLLADERAEVERQAEVDRGIAQARAQVQTNLANALRNAGSRQVSRTAGLHRDKPLNEAQLWDAAKHGKYVDGRKHSLDEAAQRVAYRTGEAISAADIKAHLGMMGTLWDDSKAMEKYLDENAGDDVIARNRLAAKVKQTYATMMLQARHDDELAKRSPDAFKQRVVELTEEERRRLDIADRTMAEAGPEWFVEKVHDRGSEGSIREALVNAVEDVPLHPDEDVRRAQADELEVERIVGELA